MKFNKFVAPVMAGALTLTLGLVGCGGSSTESTSTATTEETTATTNATTNETAAATNETAAATNETAAEDKIMFWEGETEKGDALLYGEDEENDTATIILFGDHDDKDELIAFSGPATLENGKVTITDSETGDAFSFDITGTTEEALTIDLGEHGTGTLKPVTEKEFNDTVEGIASVISAVGEELDTLDEQDIEELLLIMSSLMEDSATNATVASAE